MDCTRTFGLLRETGSLSLMGFAGRLPIEGVHSGCFAFIGFRRPRSDLFCHHEMIRLSNRGFGLPVMSEVVRWNCRCESVRRHEYGHVRGLVVSILRQQRPHDTCSLVRHRHRSDVRIVSLQRNRSADAGLSQPGKSCKSERMGWAAKCCFHRRGVSVVDPVRDKQSELGQQTADPIGRAVRSPTNPCRARCSVSTDCCSMFLIGTNRMLGQLTASQIASASAASCLLPFTYGLTNCGAIRRTAWPWACSRRAQKCAPPHASMPIRHGGILLKNTTTW